MNGKSLNIEVAKVPEGNLSTYIHRTNRLHEHNFKIIPQINPTNPYLMKKKYSLSFSKLKKKTNDAWL